MTSQTERSIRARIGAHQLHATHDSVELTRAARQASTTALNLRLLAELDPADVLPPAERERRLAHARKAHFAKLALRSAQARRRKAGSE